MKKETLPLNAMIVEDEKDLCFLLSLALQQMHLIISCANTITEAKRSIRKINPALLFLDNHLPDGSGIDFIGDVKRECPSTKIVMITAHNSLIDIKSAMSKGADCFISKPFTLAAIRNTIDLLAPAKTG